MGQVLLLDVVSLENTSLQRPACCILGAGAGGAIFCHSHLADASLSHRLGCSEELCYLYSAAAAGRAEKCFPAAHPAPLCPQVSRGRWGKPRRWTGSASWIW